MGPQDVDVIIPNYYSPHLAVDAARSARENGAKSIIVVENGSKDDSLDVLNKEIGDFAEIISLSENRGYSGACNAGAAAGHRPFILFMNSDAILQPDSLSLMVNVFNDNPQVGVVGPSLYYLDGSPQASAYLSITPMRIVFALLAIDRLSFFWPKLSSNEDKTRNDDYSGEVESLFGACTLYRRKAIEEVDGFDEGLHSNCDESDLILRLTKKGWKPYRAAESKVIHAHGKTVEKFPVKYMILAQESRRIYAKKHFNLIGRIITAFASVAGISLRVLFSRTSPDRKRYLAALGVWLGWVPSAERKW